MNNFTSHHLNFNCHVILTNHFHDRRNERKKKGLSSFSDPKHPRAPVRPEFRYTNYDSSQPIKMLVPYIYYLVLVHGVAKSQTQLSNWTAAWPGITGSVSSLLVHFAFGQPRAWLWDDQIYSVGCKSPHICNPFLYSYTCCNWRLQKLISPADNWRTQHSCPPISEPSVISTSDLKPGELWLLEGDNWGVPPTEVTIQILTSSEDVLHSWARPSLGLKRDALPQHLNQTTLMSIQPGPYQGQCSGIWKKIIPSHLSSSN